MWRCDCACTWDSFTNASRKAQAQEHTYIYIYIYVHTHKYAVSTWQCIIQLGPHMLRARNLLQRWLEVGCLTCHGLNTPWQPDSLLLFSALLSCFLRFHDMEFSMVSSSHQISLCLRKPSGGSGTRRKSGHASSTCRLWFGIGIGIGMRPHCHVPDVPPYIGCVMYCC